MARSPPELPLLLPMLEHLAQDWEVTYDIKAIECQTILYNVRLEIPSSQMRVELEKASRTAKPTEFAFPVAFSADLCQITVLEYLLRVSPADGACFSAPSQPNFWVQDLCMRSLWDPTNCNLREHDISLLRNECPCSASWYHIMFSPTSKYLAILRGPGRPSSNFMWTRMEFLILRDDGNAFPQPNFSIISRILSKVSSGVGSYCFHPTQPILAISQLSVTVLWFFEEQGMS
jgi:hypothetical protein